MYEHLSLRVWLAHGSRGGFADFRDAGWVYERANGSALAFDTGALLRFAVPDRFMTAYEAFVKCR